jgi:hypothetical protein
VTLVHIASHFCLNVELYIVCYILAGCKGAGFKCAVATSVVRFFYVNRLAAASLFRSCDQVRGSNFGDFNVKPLGSCDHACKLALHLWQHVVHGGWRQGARRRRHVPTVASSNTCSQVPMTPARWGPSNGRKDGRCVVVYVSISCSHTLLIRSVIMTSPWRLSWCRLSGQRTGMCSCC